MSLHDTHGGSLGHDVNSCSQKVSYRSQIDGRKGDDLLEHGVPVLQRLRKTIIGNFLTARFLPQSIDRCSVDPVPETPLIAHCSAVFTSKILMICSSSSRPRFIGVLEPWPKGRIPQLAKAPIPEESIARINRSPGCRTLICAQFLCSKGTDMFGQVICHTVYVYRSISPNIRLQVLAISLVWAGRIELAKSFDAGIGLP